MQLGPLSNINISAIAQNIWNKVVSLFQQRITYAALAAFSLIALTYAIYRKRQYQAHPIPKPQNPITIEDVIAKAKTEGKLDLCRILIDRTQLENIISSVPPLNTIILRNFNQFTPETISKIAPHLKELKNLDMRDQKIDDSLLKSLLEACPKLENLSLDWCDQLTLDGVIAACEKLPLQSLSLKGWKDLSRIVNLSTHLKEIRSLDFSYSNIQDQSMHAFMNFSNLEGLYLNDCKNLTAAGFDEILYLKNLTSLGLSECSIDELSLIRILIRCSKITSLNLNKCNQLKLAQEDYTKNVKATLKNMKDLHVQQTSLDHETIREMLQSCESLEFLSLPGDFPKESIPQHLKERIRSGILYMQPDTHRKIENFPPKLWDALSKGGPALIDLRTKKE